MGRRKLSGARFRWEGLMRLWDLRDRKPKNRKPTDCGVGACSMQSVGCLLLTHPVAFRRLNGYYPPPRKKLRRRESFIAATKFRWWLWTSVGLSCRCSGVDSGFRAKSDSEARVIWNCLVWLPHLKLQSNSWRLLPQFFELLVAGLLWNGGWSDRH